VDYRKTDTAGLLSPFTEHLKLYQEGVTKASRRAARKNLKHEDTICVVSVKAEPENVEQNGFQFEFKYPIISEGFDETKLISINPRQQESEMKFKVTRDSSNLRKYSLKPEGKLMSGYEYVLKVPHRKFRDINGYLNDSTNVKVSLPKDDKLSNMKVVLSGVNHQYIVDLLNEKRDKVLRTYNVSSDGTLDFPYLKAGKYSLRITEDFNGNGIIDTGNMLQHKQPEKVKFFTLKGGSYVIDIPEASEIEQRINIAKLFKDD